MCKVVIGRSLNSKVTEERFAIWPIVCCKIFHRKLGCLLLFRQFQNFCFSTPYYAVCTLQTGFPSFVLQIRLNCDVCGVVIILNMPAKVGLVCCITVVESKIWHMTVCQL